jgi:hypothetical protein
MQFDNNGFLTPYQPILTNIKDFELFFTQNKHRHDIFLTYLTLIEELKLLGLISFEHWLNGSFISKAK